MLTFMYFIIYQIIFVGTDGTIRISRRRRRREKKEKIIIEYN